MNKFLANELKENLKWIPVTEIKDDALYPQHTISAQHTYSSVAKNESPPQWTPTKQWEEFEGLNEIFTDEVIKSLSKHFSC